WTPFSLYLLAGLFGFAFSFLVQHAWLVLTVPQTPPGVVPVVPGVTIPWEAIIALAIIAIVHELAHGIACKIIGLRIKSSGMLLFGWLPVGAFVEPDENAFKRIRLRDKRRMLIAGSTSNALFFLAFLALAPAASLALQSVVAGAQVESTLFPSLAPTGARIASINGEATRNAAAANAALAKASLAGTASVEIEVKNESNGESSTRVFLPPTALVVREVKKGAPAEGALEEGEIVYSVDGARVSTVREILAAVGKRRGGEEIVFETSGGVKRFASGASASGNAFLGVVFEERAAFEARDVLVGGAESVYPFLSLLLIIFYYSLVFNFVIAAVNLLPLFLTDGQRVFFEELSATFGRRRGALISTALGVATVALLIVNALPWKSALGY
ncbi:MAG: site-2 protease family protein, partial [Candidatus Norongarragalinales archaeon]